MNLNNPDERARLATFVQESNRIEGIHRVIGYEIDAHAALLARGTVTVEDLEGFVRDVAAVPLRDREGMNVRVGSHFPPKGGPGIRYALGVLLEQIDAGEMTPYEGHVEYEKLHPFMDGNGRSGRALWAWQMLRDGRDPFALPFLHAFYYQSLDGAR